MVNNRLKEVRQKKKISQVDLAERSKVSRATISNLEAKENYVTTNKTLESIAKALGVKVKDIFFID